MKDETKSKVKKGGIWGAIVFVVGMAICQFAGFHDFTGEEWEEGIETITEEVSE